MRSIKIKTMTIRKGITTIKEKSFFGKKEEIGKELGELIQEMITDDKKQVFKVLVEVI
jgi:hypothetical protein